MEKIKLRETVIVEGKYDHIRLSSLLDANILELGGFRIYNNKQRLNLIRKIASQTGIIIMTDSDSAGFRLRHYLTGAIKEGKIVNVFIPSVKGKEKRKGKPGKEGLLGVEGMTTEVLLDALKKSGITPDGEIEKIKPFTKTELYELGLSGSENSKIIRNILCEKLDLPKMISANSLCEILPIIITKRELEELIHSI